MATTILEKKLSQLPEDKQKEVEHFIDGLLAKLQVKKFESKGETKKPMFGALKGTIIMSDDFDEPLEDFKDYM